MRALQLLLAAAIVPRATRRLRRLGSWSTRMAPRPWEPRPLLDPFDFHPPSLAL